LPQPAKSPETGDFCLNGSKPICVSRS